jgi:hypothetical protein
MILTQVDFSGLARDEDAAIRLPKAAEILAEDAQVFAAKLEGSFGEFSSSEGCAAVFKEYTARAGGSPRGYNIPRAGVASTMRSPASGSLARRIVHEGNRDRLLPAFLARELHNQMRDG